MFVIVDQMSKKMFSNQLIKLEMIEIIEPRVLVIDVHLYMASSIYVRILKLNKK